jgi:hypothetical protein
MAHTPTRPFESLEWYREAARHNFQDRRPNGLSGWVRGIGMLHAHISIFALAAVVLSLINFVASPESFWADAWILAWTVLLLIHAIALGIVWAIGQWTDDEPDEAVQMPPMPQLARRPPPDWRPGPAPVQDAQFRSSDPNQPAPAWTGWNADGADDNDQEPGERASWRVAAAAAWLDRGEQTGTPDEPKDEPHESKDEPINPT